MKEKVLYPVWGCLYILCVGLGLIPNAQGVGRVLLVLIALSFFAPGTLLVYTGQKTGNRKMLLRVRTVCIVSLTLTVVTLAANFLSVNASAETGKLLYELLALVSAPMLCAQYWVLSLFLWAALLMATIPGLIFSSKTPGSKCE